MAIKRWIPVASLLLAACATNSSTPKLTPSDQLGQVDQALLQAQEAHVDDYAAPELRAARSNYRAAQKALAGGQTQHATDLAQEALLQTELATLQARAARAKANKLQMQRDIARLQKAASLPGDSQ